MMNKLILVIVLSLAPQTILAQSSIADLNRAELKSEIVYQVPEGAEVRLAESKSGALAIWAELFEKVEIFTSTLGSRTFDGFYIATTGSPASRYFSIPMGDTNLAVVGDQPDKTFIYWAPNLGEGYQDYSEHLLQSNDGSVSAFLTQENDEQYIYKNDTRFGPYIQIFEHYLTPQNELLYFVYDGSFISIYRDGEELISGLDPSGNIINQESSFENGYIYGYDGAESFWMLHNGQLVQGVGETTSHLISPNGNNHAYFSLNGSNRTPVINSVKIDEEFEATANLIFAIWGDSFAFVGARTNASGTQELFYLRDGVVYGPLAANVRQGFHIRSGSNEFVHLLDFNEKVMVMSGQREIGTHSQASPAQTSPNGEHMVYLATTETGTSALYLDGEPIEIPLGTDIKGQNYVTDAGDLHFTLVQGDQSIRMFNNQQIGIYDNIFFDDISYPENDVLYVSTLNGKTTLHLNNNPILVSDDIRYAWFAGIAGKERMVAIVRDGEKEYLFVENQISGPFERVILDWDSIPETGVSELVFYSQDGRNYSQHTLALN